MKKWFIGGLLCAFLWMGSSSAHATSTVEPVPEKSQTEVSINLTKKITADKLPGSGGGEQTLITKPTTTSNKTLPQTGEKTSSFYLLLGTLLTIFSLFLYVFKKKKDVENYEAQ
ncbi:MAG: LPXTG cell wall anchor domain-containing protein [Enterococcus sp.]|nr:LPXTG cell wall anchor domain-containing protein [Enterococcus sp.]